MSLPEAIRRIFVSPLTGAPLRLVDNGLRAEGDPHEYRWTEGGQLDLRLPQPKTVRLDFELGRPPDLDGVEIKVLCRNQAPEVDFASIDHPGNINRDTLSYFPRAAGVGSLALDLGCGPADYRELFEYAGFVYVGADISHPQAPILADAQALPFLDDSFEFVWSGAMMQYVPFAFPTIREVARVLRPGGRFIGTIGFLEAFDGNSFQMYTSSGVLNLLRYGGLEVQVLAPDHWWTGLTAITSMGLFPRIPHRGSRVVVAPLEWASKLWWRLAALKNPEYSEAARLTRVTGDFLFVAVKPERPAFR